LTHDNTLIKIIRLVALFLVPLPYRSDRGNAMHTMLRLALACVAVLSSTPGMAQTPLERGVAAVEAERFQEAIAILTQALDGRQLKSVEEIGLAYWHRGRAKASLDDCAGAIPDWEEAMALDASPDVYSSLGFCHFQLKQYEEAIPYLVFDAKNFPNAATFTLLGKAQALTDDFDGAEASFRSALELTPDYADAKKGLAAVKELRAERTGGAPASGSQSAQPPAGAKAAATPAAEPASANCKIAGVQLGVDTVASVERDIQTRGGSPLTGGSGPAKYRVSTMSGDYQDAGFDPMAVNYDFDAAGPAGRLVAVTIVNRANTGPGYETMLASRKAAAAAIAGPLQQKSATELVAAGPGCQLRLLPNADTWFIHEVYQLPN
jgi:hypothetical protein